MKFKFPPNVVSLDTVPDQFKGLYTEDADGTYKLADFAVGAVEAIQGLNKALDASRTEAKELKSSRVDLSALAEYGETPEEIAESVQARMQEAAGKKVDIDKIKSALQESHEKALTKEQARAAAYKSQLETVMVRDAAMQAITAEKGDPQLLMPHVRDRVRMVETQAPDGTPQFQVQVLGDDGEPAYGNTGEPQTIKELVGGMKADKTYGRLFESEAPSGGGQRRNPTTPAGQPARGTSANDKIANGLANRI